MKEHRERKIKMVDLGGYVIILVETNDKRVKLYGEDIHFFRERGGKRGKES